MHCLISTRETDIVGWYRNGSVIGVIFTEIGAVDDSTVRKVLLRKLRKCFIALLLANRPVRSGFRFNCSRTPKQPMNPCCRSVSGSGSDSKTRRGPLQ